jgi:colicin import membrane protein
MKKIILAAALCFPLITTAQNTWEMPEVNQQSQNPDAKYLLGAVPEENGKVVFRKTIDAPGKTAKQIYDIIENYMQKMTKEPNQLEQSRVSVADPDQGQLIGTYQEWLVFKQTALVTDRTRFFYALSVNCFDGRAEASITNIFYLYDEERLAQNYKAEDWITDKYGLKKKQDKLSRVSGKFRRKTIDRKDYIFNKLESLLK